MDRVIGGHTGSKVAPRLPYVAEVGVIGLVPDRWGGAWQPRQHVLTRLAMYFNVVWINPAREWRELWFRKAPRYQGADLDGTVTAGFAIYDSGKWLPLLYRPRSLARFIARQRLRRAHRILRDRGCRKTVLYLWRPEYEPALDLISCDLSCYHIDDEYTFSDTEKSVEESEARLILRVDQVFIHSPALLEKKGHLNPHTAFIPNGVDYRAYATILSEPVDMREIPHPRIGYTGFLKRQLDWPLLLHLTAQHPEWSFVFVGSQSPHSEIAGAIQELSGRPNVYFLGAKSVRDLAAYPQHFDVCLMPYWANDYTKYIYPLKLHEYLASGRPTVGTRIRSLEEFVDVVALPSTPDEWSAAITEALSPAANTAERRAARQTVARRHDWDVLVKEIARTIAQRLGREYVERFERAVRTTDMDQSRSEEL